MLHYNDLLLEPLKKISFKLFVAKKSKWWHGDYKYVTHGIDSVGTFREIIQSRRPAMVARYGSTELTCVLAHILSQSKRSYLKNVSAFLKGEIPTFWYGIKNTSEICDNSGFFPNDVRLIERFSERMLNDTKLLDVFLTWMDGEKYIFPYFPTDCKIISLWDIQPFFQHTPWTMFLEGKKVLVIHPYAKSIANQYQRRQFVFPDKQILPNMSLITFKAVQTIRNNKSEFSTWFEALNYMTSQIKKIDFDIALIGAGAYGFPLAADIKRMGKIAFHIGGSLQLYFGIRGQRWDVDPNFQKMFNEYWVRPLAEEHPNNYTKGEGAVYW